MRELKAVFFGSIGTIAETSALQRLSYNLAFKKFGIDCYWNTANYCNMLQIPGGKDRIEKFTVEGLSSADINKIHCYKEELFAELIEQEDITRNQFVEVFHHCKASEIKLGLITTTSKKNIDSLSNALSQKVNFSDFDIVTDNTCCKHPKPNPEIYDTALKRIKLDPDQVIAIEDTEVNLSSPQSAKINSILFPGEYSNYDPKASPKFDLMEAIFKI
jgi:HAD superfamily hydrolase (TIGR01509 family)